MLGFLRKKQVVREKEVRKEPSRPPLEKPVSKRGLGRSADGKIILQTLSRPKCSEENPCVELTCSWGVANWITGLTKNVVDKYRFPNLTIPARVGSKKSELGETKCLHCGEGMKGGVIHVG